MEYIGFITSITLLQEDDSLILLMRQMVDHNGSSSWRLWKREREKKYKYFPVKRNEKCHLLIIFTMFCLWLSLKRTVYLLFEMACNNIHSIKPQEGWLKNTWAYKNSLKWAVFLSWQGTLSELWTNLLPVALIECSFKVIWS